MSNVVAGFDVAKACAEVGLNIQDNPSIVDDLASYLHILLRWNKVINLVGSDNPQQIFHSLVVDSFSLASFFGQLSLPPEPHTFDLGAGAGLPGIPLRMLWKRGIYVMVELRKKRAAFLQNCLAAIDLPGTRVLEGDAAEALAAVQPKPDLILSRAFKPWPEVLAMVEDNISASGRVIIMTSEKRPRRLAQGWSLESSYCYEVISKDLSRPRYFWSLRRP